MIVEWTNPGKAAEGKRLHKLEPYPVTAPVVERIFTEYVTGRGMTSIARELTQDGIACPSAYNRLRNPNRRTRVWDRSPRDLAEPRIHRPTSLEPGTH